MKRSAEIAWVGLLAGLALGSWALSPAVAEEPSGEGSGVERPNLPEARPPPAPQLTRAEQVYNWLKERIFGPTSPGGGRGMGKPWPDGARCGLEGQSRWIVLSPGRVDCQIGTWPADEVPVRFEAVPGAARYDVSLRVEGEPRDQREGLTASGGVVEARLGWPEVPPGRCWSLWSASVEIVARDASGACLSRAAPIGLWLTPPGCLAEKRAQWARQAADLCAQDGSAAGCGEDQTAMETRLAMEAGYFGEAAKIAEGWTRDGTAVGAELEDGVRWGPVAEVGCGG